MPIQATSCQMLRDKASAWSAQGSPRAALAAIHLAQFVSGADRWTRERILPRAAASYRHQHDSQGETCPTPFQEVYDMYLEQAELQAKAGRTKYAMKRMSDFLERFADAPETLLKAAAYQIEHFSALR
jgi:hypothetical protein